LWKFANSGDHTGCGLLELKKNPTAQEKCREEQCPPGSFLTLHCD
jgi:hypothetical protein